MPQLDPTFYTSQLFWLVLTFVPLLFILWKVALPRVSAVLETRQARLDGDLAQAAALRDEAAKLTADYEKALAGAHDKARGELRKVAEAMAAEAAKRHAALAAKLGEQIKDAETRIAAAKDAALANIRGVAGEAAVAAAERLIGVKVKRADVDAAIDQALGERR